MAVSATQAQRGGRNAWLLCLALAAGAAAMTYLPEGMAQLRYERGALSAGQAWRVLSAHLVHLNTAHLLHNLLGLLLIREFLWRDMAVMHGLGLLLASAAGVCAGLWWFHPDLAWYAGLSGALHGLWAGCALAACWPRRATVIVRPGRDHDGVAIGIIALLILAAKLCAELLPGSLVAEGMGGIPTVPFAHFHGALAGVLYVVIWRGNRRAEHIV